MANLFDMVTARPWAIEPGWLPVIADVAQRRDVAEAMGEHLGMTLEMLRDRLDRGGQRQRGDVVNGVGVVELLGPIFPRANLMTDFSGATSLQMFADEINAMLADPGVRAIVLSIDSPGGAVTDTAEAARLVRAAHEQKPVTAVVTGLGASAAYWIAAGAGEIVVQDTAVVGSIGIVTASAKQVEPDHNGRIEIEVVSANAHDKRPDPTTDEGKATMRATLDALEGVFVAEVGRLRGMSREAVTACRGGVRIGAEAVACGLADRVGSLQDILAELGGTTAPADAGATANVKGNHMTDRTNQAEPAADETGKTITPEAPEDTAEAVGKAYPGAAAALRAEGAQAERDRIAGIDARCGQFAHHAELIAKLKADGKTSPVEAAAAVLEAEGKRGNRHLADMAADDAALADVEARASADGSDTVIEESDAPLEDRCKATWQKDAKLRAEFGDNFARYLAFENAEAQGKVRILRKAG